MNQHVPALAEETIGQRLRRLRLERGLSQRELAAPGVSYAYISRIEAGTRQPSVKALRRLAGKLGVTAAYLETGSYLDPSRSLELTLSDLELAVRLGGESNVAERLEAVLEEAVETGDGDAALRARVALAIVAREAGEFRRVIELLEDVTHDEPFMPVEHIELYGQLGYAYSASGRPELAIELFERCLDGVRQQGATASYEARYATLLSYALSDVSEVARAEKVVRETLARVGHIEDPHVRVRLYWSFARVAHAENRPALALANMRKAIALLEATEDTLALARAHLLATSIVLTRADPDAAAEHLDAAERLLGAAPSLADHSMLQVKRAQVAALRGDGPTAVALARAALEEVGDSVPGERGSALFALGDGLTLVGSFDEADDAYRGAVELLEGLQQWREATQACRARAKMLRTAGREREALDVLDRAAELGLKAAPADPVRS